MEHLKRKTEEVIFLMNNSSQVQMRRIYSILSSMTARQVSDLEVNGVIDNNLIEAFFDHNVDDNLNRDLNCDETCGCLYVELTETDWNSLMSNM